MKKILLIFFLFCSVSAFAAELRPTLRQITDLAEGKTVYSSAQKNSILQSFRFGWSVPDTLLVYGKGDPSSMLKYGARIQTKTGKFFTALVPVSSLPALKSENAVEFLDYGFSMEKSLNVVFPYVSANQSEAAGYRGDDVLIGVVDTGIDVFHEDFKTDNGLSRILYLWDQTGSGTAPSGFDYGREWTKAEIDSGLCNEVDTDFHGTHVAGIATGSGKSSDGVYKGISPRATLIFVKANLTMSYVLDGVNYIFYKAQQLKKPCVVNISLGNHYGSHTENDDYCRAMDSIIDYYGRNGNVIVWAAGNEGALSIHLHAMTNLSTSSAVDIPFYYSSSPMYLYFWHDVTNGLEVKITGPSGIVVDFTNTSTFSTIANSDLDLDSGVNSAGERYLALTVHSVYSGTWNVTFQSNASAAQVDGYINNYSASSRYFLKSSTNGSLTAQAVQKLALCVTAVVSKTTYTNYLGTVYISGPTYNLDDRLYYAGVGPARDGQKKPDVSAPGSKTVSTYANTPGHSLFSSEIINSYYAVMEGTSMAAPVVTGIVAQLLEKEPYLTVDDVRQLFVNYAMTNSYKPNRTWDPAFGYGIADLAFLTSVNASQAKLDVSLKNNVMNVSGNKDNKLYVLFRSNSSQLGSTVRAAVYDRNGGLVLDFGSEKITQIKVKEYSWNGKDQFGRTVQPGMYFVQVSVDNTVSRYPVLVVR